MSTQGDVEGASFSCKAFCGETQRSQSRILLADSLLVQSGAIWRACLESRAVSPVSNHLGHEKSTLTTSLQQLLQFSPLKGPKHSMFRNRQAARRLAL